MQVICFRSVAQYTFDLLSVSAETGGEVVFY
jgi:sarcosine oxidase subunit gamma